MTTDQLSLYNGSLRLLGQRKLASLTEDNEPRHLLDDVWAEGAVKAVLEEGLWNFAMRTAEISADTSIDPSFGMQYAFSKPSDWVSTAGMFFDPYLRNALRDEDCKDEAGYWWANQTPIYARFVSNDNSYGSDLSKWPQSFCNFVHGYLALKISPRIVKAANQREEFEKKYFNLRMIARGRDAMNEGSPSLPAGRFVNARRGGGSRTDRGSRSSFTG